eukprot:TCONS_00040766-protein
MADVFKCLKCNRFEALSLRCLLNHYRSTHANESSFNVTCNVDGCPATFSIYNSLYKHITRKHKEVYYRQQNEGIIINPQNANEIEVDEEPANIENFDDTTDTSDNEDLYGNNNNPERAADLTADEQQQPLSSSSSASEDEQEDEDENDHAHQQNNDFIEDSQLHLKKCAAMFLLKSKERNKLSQV